MGKVDDVLELSDLATQQAAFLELWAARMRDRTRSAANDDDLSYRRTEQRLIEKIDEEVRYLKILTPRISKEGSEFAIKVRQSEYAEQLEDIDRELASRETNFRTILSQHRWYTNQLAGRIRHEGRANDSSITVAAYEASAALLFAGQVIGKNGFLTGDGLEPTYRSSAAHQQAESSVKASKRLFKESVSLSRKLFLKYRVRYVRSFIKRFAREAAISFVIFGLLVEFLLHRFHVEFFVSGIAILALAYIAERVVSANLKKRRIQYYSRTLFNDARNLYSDYLIFLRARAIARVATFDKNKGVTDPSTDAIRDL